MDDKKTMHHLGLVLYILADLHEDDRCKALDEALEYYNKHNPTEKIEAICPGMVRLEIRGFD